MIKIIKIILGNLLLFAVIVGIGITTEGDYNGWEGGVTHRCCDQGYCYTLVNDECSDEMWNRAVCTKYNYCKPGVEKLVDVEGVVTE